MRLRIEHCLVGRFGMIVALAVAVGAANHFGAGRAIDDGRWIGHTHAVLEQIERVASLLKDAETGQRGFLLVGRDDYLGPYHDAIDSIGREFDRLAELTRDNPVQRARIGRLRDLADRRLALNRQTIEVRRTEGLDAALALVRTDRGRRLMDEIRGLARVMRDEEYTLLERRSERAVAANRIVAILTWIGTATSLVVLLFAYRVVVRELARRRLIEGRLRESQARFQAFMEHSPAVTFMKDASGRIAYVNGPLERLFGVRSEDVKGRTTLPGSSEEAVAEDAAILATGRPLQRLEEVTTPVGRRHSLLVTKFGFRDASGRMVLGGIGFDITEQKELEARLERANARLVEQATSDGLTGLKNRRSLDESIASLASSAARHDEPLSIVLLDVDHFKGFNDSFGHQAGDDVLRAVAATLRASVREHDVVARYGGEEFAVLLPLTDRDAALVVAERLRRAIEEHHSPLRPITVSLGVATLTPDATAPRELLERADQALYHSKQRGRNRVTHFEEMSRPLSRV